VTALTWSSPGERIFETGVDKGVLYIDGAGYAWSGLVSVQEAPSGGEAQPYYQDGYKYLNLHTTEDFGATIEAFTAPEAFGVCDGTAALAHGLFVTQQPRKSFDFSYRTLVGNDLAGTEYGYKTHLVYGALAAPSQRTYSTIGSSPEPVRHSWSITTTPKLVKGLKPSAHFILDSTKTPPGLMREVEDILYGTDASNPRLPELSELMELFSEYAFIYVYVDNEDGTEPYIMEQRVYLSPTVPNIPAGQDSLLWLDNSGGDYVTLNLVTGDE
jgi:hypothetical protein